VLGDGPRIFWDPATGLCDRLNGGNCLEITQWRQRIYEVHAGNTWWHALACSTIVNCMPDDFERSLIAKFVQEQGIYRLEDGTLTSSYQSRMFSDLCTELAADMDVCTSAAAEQHTGNLRTIGDLAQALTVFLGGGNGGERPQEKITEEGMNHSWGQHAYGTGTYYRSGIPAERANVFNQDVNLGKLREHINNALLRGRRVNREPGDTRGGWYRDYDTTYPIGLTGRTVIRLVFDDAGNLVTAFPFM
jgi:hypothetical protein